MWQIKSILKLWSVSKYNYCIHIQTIYKSSKPHKTSQNTHKLPTNQPNHPLINQKSNPSFPEEIFLWLSINSGPKNRNICHPTKYGLLPNPLEKRNGFIFLMFLPDFAFRPLHSTVHYDPINKWNSNRNG